MTRFCVAKVGAIDVRAGQTSDIRYFQPAIPVHRLGRIPSQTAFMLLALCSGLAECPLSPQSAIENKQGYTCLA